MNYARLSTIPSQMVSDSVKQTDKWKQENINSFETLTLFDANIRANYTTKVRNYNLRQNVIDYSDIERICDLHGLGLDSFPSKPKHIGIENVKIDVLVGEQMKRRFDFTCTLSSEDSISKKEEVKKEKYQRFLLDKLQSESSPEELEKDLKRFDTYIKYSFQDIAEIGANKILNYAVKKYIEPILLYERTFEDLLIAGECGSITEENNGELVKRKIDPLRSFAIMSANSTDENGLDAFVEVDYLAPSKVVDVHYEDLTKEQIQQIESWRTTKNASDPYAGIRTPQYDYPGYYYNNPGEPLPPYRNNYWNRFVAPYDGYGNVRVLRVWWKSKRKIKKIKSYNELGIEVFSYKDEHYKVDKSIGEEVVKDIWINEWWHGTKIGNDIYVKIEPIPFLKTSFKNISDQMCPITFQIMNTNSNKAKSLVDAMYDITITYDIFYWKRMLLAAKVKGDLLLWRNDMMPDDMTPEQYFHYIEISGELPVDPSAQIIEGTNMGKSAGQVNNTIVPTYISSTQARPIEVFNSLMIDLERLLAVVSGVSPQREGAIKSTELVGAVERSVQQSTYSTEKFFFYHDEFKRRDLEKTLNYTLSLLRKNPQKFSYLLSDYEQVVLSDEELNSALLSEFDIHVSHSTKDQILLQKYEGLAEVALKEGKAKFSQLMNIYKTQSMQKALADIRAWEEEMEMQQNKIAEQQNKINSEKLQQELRIKQIELELKNAELELKKYEIDESNKTKINVAMIQSYNRQQVLDQDNDGIPDPIELGNMALYQQEVNLKQQEINQKNVLENRKLDIEEKSIEASKQIEKMKLKNKVVGEK